MGVLFAPLFLCNFLSNRVALPTIKVKANKINTEMIVSQNKFERVSDNQSSRWNKNMSNNQLAYTTKFRSGANKLTKTEIELLGSNDYKEVRISECGKLGLWVRTEFREVVEIKWKPIPLWRRAK